jgi:transposase, IS5 family
MYRNRHHRCKHPIVSISQPHVRPILRGKVAQSVEFGAKISVSHVDGYVSLDRLTWEAYNDSNIRLTGKPLGRPRAQTREEKRQQRQDEMERIVIEGKFGNIKRKGTLQRVMAKLANTSRTVIVVGIVVLHLDHWLRFIPRS